MGQAKMRKDAGTYPDSMIKKNSKRPYFCLRLKSQPLNSSMTVKKGYLKDKENVRFVEDADIRTDISSVSTLTSYNAIIDILTKGVVKNNLETLPNEELVAMVYKRYNEDIKAAMMRFFLERGDLTLEQATKKAETEIQETAEPVLTEEKDSKTVSIDATQ